MNKFHNQEYEMSVLGSVLLDNSALSFIHYLKPIHFADASLAKLYGVMREMDASGEPIDLVSLRAKAGGEYIELLMNCSEIVPTASNVEYYAKNVRDYAQLRKLYTRVTDFQGKIEVGDINIKNAQEAINDLGAGLLATDVDDYLISMKDDLQEYLPTIHDPEQTREVFSTGIDALDKILRGGLERQEVLVFGGRPGMGKTTLMLNMLNKCILQGRQNLVLSLEMSYKDLRTKILSLNTGIPMFAIEEPWRMTASQKERVAEVAGSMFMNHQNNAHFIDDPRISLDELQALATKMKHGRGLDVLWVDYLQLLSGDGENRNQELTKISRQFKIMARSLDIAVVLLVQLNRGVEARENKRPRMSDIRDSGGIEQDADKIVFLYRDEYYNPDSVENKGLAEAIIAKNRRGRDGKIEMRFDGAKSLFTDLT